MLHLGPHVWFWVMLPVMLLLFSWTSRVQMRVDPYSREFDKQMTYARKVYVRNLWATIIFGFLWFLVCV